MKRINYIPGQIVNNHGIMYVLEQPFIIVSNVKRRTAIFKCQCEKEFISIIKDVVYNKRTSCGCKKGSKPKIYKKGDLINKIKFIRTCGTFKYAQKAIFECPICKKEWESLVSNIQAGNTKSCCGYKRGWSKCQWVKLSKTSKLYKVRLYNQYESFIKIGITTKSVEERFKSIPYNLEILKVIEGDSSYIFELELKTKIIFKKYRYKPLISFKGETECYNN